MYGYRYVGFTVIHTLTKDFGGQDGTVLRPSRRGKKTTRHKQEISNTHHKDERACSSGSPTRPPPRQVAVQPIQEELDKNRNGGRGEIASFFPLRYPFFFFLVPFCFEHLILSPRAPGT